MVAHNELDGYAFPASTKVKTAARRASMEGGKHGQLPPLRKPGRATDAQDTKLHEGGGPSSGSAGRQNSGSLAKNAMARNGNPIAKAAEKAEAIAKE